MTIQDWGAFGEIVGAVAVVASLVYLAVQIRQNTRQLSHSIEAARIASLERNIESSNHLREILILNPDLAELWLSGLEDFCSLKGVERIRFEMLLRNIFSAFQGAYVRHLSIHNESEDFTGTARMIEAILEKRGARDCLAQALTDWRPEFSDFIDARLASIDSRATQH
jgi:hypothetical protein